MRWSLAILALIVLALAVPANGSFHETIGIVPDRMFTLAMQGTSFNGLHAPDAPLLEAYVGERVRFNVVAAETHTFHLHGHPWLSEGKVIDTFLMDPQTPHAFDVSAGGVGRNTGDWMYHCHVDVHMQAGMWGVFRVYPFATKVEQIGNTLDVSLARLGTPLDGAQLALALDGEPLLAHVEARGDGVYLVHTQLPATGVLVVTATHPELGESIARVALGGVSPATLTVTSHAHTS